MKNAAGHPGAEKPTWRALGEVLRTAEKNDSVWMESKCEPDVAMLVHVICARGWGWVVHSLRREVHVWTGGLRVYSSNVSAGVLVVERSPRELETGRIKYWYEYWDTTI